MLFAGSYDERDVLMLCDLSARKPAVERLRPVDGSGHAIEWQRAFPAGRSMYLQTGRDLYRVDAAAL